MDTINYWKGGHKKEIKNLYKDSPSIFDIQAYQDQVTSKTLLTMTAIRLHQSLKVKGNRNHTSIKFRQIKR